MQDFRFESAYIFGAICPAEQKSSALIFTSIGAEEMSLHLQEISKRADINTHIVMIMDRSPWLNNMIMSSILL